MHKRIVQGITHAHELWSTGLAYFIVVTSIRLLALQLADLSVTREAETTSQRRHRIILGGNIGCMVLILTTCRTQWWRAWWYLRQRQQQRQGYCVRTQQGRCRWKAYRKHLTTGEARLRIRTSTVKLDHVWALKKWPLNTGGLCIEVKINSKVTFGTQPSGLYREVVSEYRWSLRQVSLCMGLRQITTKVVSAM